MDVKTKEVISIRVTTDDVQDPLPSLEEEASKHREVARTYRLLVRFVENLRIPRCIEAVIELVATATLIGAITPGVKR